MSISRKASAYGFWIVALSALLLGFGATHTSAQTLYTTRIAMGRGQVTLDGSRYLTIDFYGLCLQALDGTLSAPSGSINISGSSGDVSLTMTARSLTDMSIVNDGEYKIATLTSAPVWFADRSDYVPGDPSSIVYRVVIAQAVIRIPLRPNASNYRGQVSLELYEIFNFGVPIGGVPMTSIAAGSSFIK
jgi:hypothetical protein